MAVVVGVGVKEVVEVGVLLGCSCGETHGWRLWAEESRRVMADMVALGAMVQRGGREAMEGVRLELRE